MLVNSNIKLWIYASGYRSYLHALYYICVDHFCTGGVSLAYVFALGAVFIACIVLDAKVDLFF